MKVQTNKTFNKRTYILNTHLFLRITSSDILMSKKCCENMAIYVIISCDIQPGNIILKNENKIPQRIPGISDTKTLIHPYSPSLCNLLMNFKRKCSVTSLLALESKTLYYLFIKVQQLRKCKECCLFCPHWNYVQKVLPYLCPATMHEKALRKKKSVANVSCISFRFFPSVY